MLDNTILCGNCRKPTTVSIFGQPPNAAMMKAVGESGWLCDDCADIKAEWHRTHDYESMIEESEL